MQITTAKQPDISPVFNRFDNSKGVSYFFNKDSFVSELSKQKTPYKFGALIGSVAGVLISMLLMRNKKNSFPKSFVSIDYNASKIIAMGNMSVIGGFLGGLVDSKGKNKKEKLKEAIYQSVCNMTLPTMISGALFKKCKNIPIKNPILKSLFNVGVNTAGFSSGLFAGREFLNIFDKTIKKERPIKARDFIFMVDDIPTIFALSGKNGNMISQLIPLCAVALGEETGTKK